MQCVRHAEIRGRVWDGLAKFWVHRCYLLYLAAGSLDSALQLGLWPWSWRQIDSKMLLCLTHPTHPTHSGHLPAHPSPHLSGGKGPDSTLYLLVRLRLLARGCTSLCMAERTRCPILLSPWSYVTILLTNGGYISHYRCYPAPGNNPLTLYYITTTCRYWSRKSSQSQQPAL